MFLLKCTVFCIIAGTLIDPVHSSGSDCPSSSSGCMSQVNFNQLSANNLSDYCTQGPWKVQQAMNCINQCNFQLNIPNELTQALQDINSTCNGVSECSGIVDRYMQFNQCFDQSISSIFNNIIGLFNAGQNLDIACGTFRQYRSCQNRNVGSCSYLKTLQQMFFIMNPHFNDVLYICGSENVPNITFTDGCSATTDRNIVTQCGIACNAINAPNVNNFCSTLQSQVDCITTVSSTCTSLQVKYLQPRLDSYALVNQFLGCNISVEGIVVKSRALSGTCDYRSLLNTCFNLNLITPVPFNTVQRLLNFDFPIDDLCNMNSQAQNNRINDCSDAFSTCLLPVAQVFPYPSSYDGSYNLNLGTFPLNLWGLKSVFASCPSDPFQPTAICTAATVTNPNSTPPLKVKVTPKPITATPATPAVPGTHGTPATLDRKRATPTYKPRT